MKTKVTRKRLAEAFAAVKGLVSADCASPFGMVRLDAAGPNISLTGTDGSTQVEFRVEGETDEDGTLVLPGAKLGSFVGAMPEGAVEIDGAPGERARIAAGEAASFRLEASGAVDFPPMSGPARRSPSHAVLAPVLKEMIRSVKSAAAPPGDDRAQLRGVNVRAGEDGTLEMTASDGRWLAHIGWPEPPGTGGAPVFDITLANKTVNALDRLLDDRKGYVTIQADSGAARITGDSWSMTAKVVEGKYPDWRMAVPGNPQHKAELGRADFLNALRRAALAAGGEGKYSPVDVSLEDGLVVCAASGVIASAEARATTCRLPSGGKMSFIIDAAVLMAALQSVGDEAVTLGFGWAGSPGPVLLRCERPWLAAVMPLH